MSRLWPRPEGVRLLAVLWEELELLRRLVNFEGVCSRLCFGKKVTAVSLGNLLGTAYISSKDWNFSIFSKESNL